MLNPKPAKWISEPTLRQLSLLLSLACLSFGLTASALHGWRSLILGFGDNAAYLEVATAIRHWDFHAVGIQHFMGYPYAIAATSYLSRLSLTVCLPLVAGIASTVSTFVVAQLFGTRIAAFFALSNFAWLQSSLLGGSEPLAVALGTGALLVFRRKHFLFAALLASLAATVRPLMIFVLVGIGIAMITEKRYRQFLTAVAVAAITGLLYVWPLAHYFGDPLLTVHSYTSRDYGAANVSGPHGHLFGWPFHGIIAGTILYPAPWTNLILSFAWIALVLIGISAMFSRELRNYWHDHLNEAVFCGCYLMTIFSYDYLIWARSNFFRFAIPVLPFVFFALRRWLPRDRRVLWILAAVAPALAACSAIGIKNVFLFR